MLEQLKKRLAVGEHVCPVWMAYTFDNPLRKLIHDPEKMFKGLVGKGRTVMDIGCGMGYFSIGMAKMVGGSGSVISADLQLEMLEILKRRAKAAGVGDRIRTHKCGGNSIGYSEPVDFILASWLVHEVPNLENFFREVRALMKPNARFLMLEPKMHVKKPEFDKSVELARTHGLVPLSNPPVALSRSILFSR